MPFPPRPAQIMDFDALPSGATEGGARQWVARGAHFILLASEAKAGTVLLRAHDPDEHFVLLPERLGATVAAGDESASSAGDALFIVPPGASRIELAGDGVVWQVFTARSEDLAARAVNADAYASGAPDVAPLAPWPMPPDGYRLRAYELPAHVRSDINMRLFRTRCLMLNVFTRQHEPRDIRRMTPHAHADFEQGALVLEGRHVHHLRYPWTADMTAWREDEHVALGARSFTLIPPNVVHTTQAVDTAPTRLVEIFAPPREDFSLVPGRVCNADEYPLPADLQARAPLSA